MATDANQDDEWFDPREESDGARDANGNLVAGPRNPEAEARRLKQEDWERSQRGAEQQVAKGTEETRDAISEKIPMGPEPRPEAPAPIIAGDDETADKYGEGDGARDADGNLI